MTKDQKTLLRSLAVLAGFKAALIASIFYSASYYRKTMDV